MMEKLIINNDCCLGLANPEKPTSSVVPAASQLIFSVLLLLTDTNTLDSYAEALKTDGQYALSIDYYKRILNLNPSNIAAQDAIKEMEEPLKNRK